MPIRLIIVLLAILLTFLYLTFLNPALVTIHLASDFSLGLPVSIIMAASFIAGVLSVMALYFQDTLRDAFVAMLKSFSDKNKQVSKKLCDNAVQSLRVDKRKEAKKLFRKTLARDPENMSALVGLGKMQREDGQMLEAIETHSRARGLDATHVTNLLELADDYVAAERFPEAVVTLNETRTLVGDTLPPLEKIREIYINAVNWKEAVTTQRLIISLCAKTEAEKQKRLLSALVYEDGLDTMAAGELLTARESFKSAIKHDSRFLPAYLKLAETEDKLGWKVDAVKALEKGIKTTGSILLLKALEALLLSRGEREKVVTTLKWAKNQLPDQDTVGLFLAQAHVRLEDYRAARLELEALDGRLSNKTMYHLLDGKIRQGENNTDSAMESMNRAYSREEAVFFRFTCSSCGSVTGGYSGRCKTCGQWNSLEVTL